MDHCYSTWCSGWFCWIPLLSLGIPSWPLCTPQNPHMMLSITLCLTGLELAELRLSTHTTLLQHSTLMAIMPINNTTINASALIQTVTDVDIPSRTVIGQAEEKLDSFLQDLKSVNWRGPWMPTTLILLLLQLQAQLLYPTLSKHLPMPLIEIESRYSP